MFQEMKELLPFWEARESHRKLVNQREGNGSIFGDLFDFWDPNEIWISPIFKIQMKFGR